jgi:hypothetical protein
MHWCLGMYSSASTWAYNVTLRIAVSLFPTRQVDLHFVYPTQSAQLHFTRHPHRAFAPDDHIHIVKSHDVDDEDAVLALATQADAIIITIRDPRDAVASLMLYQKYNFPLSLSIVENSARLCARFAHDRRSLVLRYEAGFSDQVTTLDRIAASFNQQLAPVDRARIFAAVQRKAVEAFIAELPRRPQQMSAHPGDLFDPWTHWHAHHAGRTGEVGRWRQVLNDAQVSEVERRLGEWIDRFAYQRRPVQPSGKPHEELKSYRSG